MTKEKEGFLPEGYKEPQGNYMKWQDGENIFRVLSSAVVGYEYWTADTKPVRAKEAWTSTPADIKKDKDGKPTGIKHFWYFAVWNYTAEKVQVLEITQKGIMSSMKAYIMNEKWGDPKTYDFIVTKSGSGFDTDYVVSVNPKSDAPKATFDGDLESIFDGGDPFMSKEAVASEKAAQAEFEGK